MSDAVVGRAPGTHRRRREVSSAPTPRYLWLLLLLPLSLAAQEPVPPFEPPLAGSWAPVRSIGQPPAWRRFLGAGYAVDRTRGDEGSGALVSLGAQRYLLLPVHGALATRGQVYLRQRGLGGDVGATLHLESPALFLLTGMDWSVRTGRLDPSVGVSFPPVRGGIFARGGEIRLEYIPARGHSFKAAAVLPLRDPLAGRTRPRSVDVPLPRGPELAPAPLPPAAAAATDSLTRQMQRVASLGTFFWLTETQSLRYATTVNRWREALRDFRNELDAETQEPGTHGAYARSVLRYHESLELAFRLATGAAVSHASYDVGMLAEQARRVTLDEVILPYNRTIGQYKQPDRLDGLTARARARWLAWLELESGLPAAVHPGVLAVLDVWLEGLEAVRAEIDRQTGDSRMHWLPLALALRPEEHRYPEQIDALVGRALGREFERGNAVLSINAPQFQLELERSLRETERYHVLWIHDYAGRNGRGEHDRTAFHITVQGYLRSLTDAVRAYDRTGTLPVFLIFLDQYYYELNGGERWMTLLERPLTHTMRLPRSHEEMARGLAAMQDSLRAAVASSRRLQAEARSFGPEWLERTVKVHVNITYPSDFSFRSRRLLTLPVGADNLSRDHRKLVIRDVAADEPGRGEVILAGVGVGDHFATATWEDRALIVQGPGAFAAVEQARELLRRHAIPEEELPEPLRYRPRAVDHADRVGALEAAGATARFLQVHNETGWGDKSATFVEMLLFDLAPPGTVLYVPDSLWSGAQWMAQLVAAALRGCHVIVVAPARDNGPSPSGPQRAVMQDLLARLVLVEEVLGEAIREGGGDLRVGLYSRVAPLDDLPAALGALEETMTGVPFLRELFPLNDAAWDEIRAAAERPVEPRPIASWMPVSDPQDRAPQLHRKTHWIVDRAAVRTLAASPEMAGLVRDALGGVHEAVVHDPESGPLVAQERTALTRRLVKAHESGVEASDGLLYYTNGSMNMNVRSMTLDGEVVGIVAGAWALEPFFDFLLFSGGVTWVESLEEMERLVPPFSSFKRRLGRWLLRLM